MALDRLDPSWQQALESSLLYRFGAGIVALIAGHWSRLSIIGTLAQRGGFVIMVALFAVIALPQFAAEKDALALVVVAGLGLRIAGLFCGGKERYVSSAIDAVVIAYFACNFVAACSSHYLLPSLKGLAKMCVYVGSYFFFTSCLQHDWRRRTVTVLGTALLLALVVSLYGLYQFKIGVAPLATWEDPNSLDKTTRIYSTLRNPNLLAGYLVPLVPVAAAMALAAWSWSGFWRVFSLVFAGTAGAIALAVFLTGSRGGYIGLGFELLLFGIICFEWLWQAKPKLRLPALAVLIAAPLVMVAVVHFALPSVESRFISLFSGAEHSSNAYRLNVWKSSWKMFCDSWWFGIGPGKDTFCLAYGLYMRSGFDALGTYCVPLEVAVEGGIGALLAFCALALAVMARAHCRFWEQKDWLTRWLVAGSACGFAGVLAHGLGDTVLFRPQVQLLFWLLISVVVSAPAKNSNDIV